MNDIQQIIKSGESEKIEFKESFDIYKDRKGR